MDDWKTPPPSYRPGEQPTGWRRKWPVVTLFSAVGVILLGIAIAWTYTVHFRKFPPDRADPAALAWPLPEGPSVVVLPISAVTSTDRDILLAERYGDDLIELFSRVPGLFVISPETSSRFGGGQFRIKSTAEQLGVRYLVTGNLSRSGGTQYRVLLKVIDAFSGEPEWVKDFDIDPEHLFEVSAKALLRMLDAMDVDLEEGGLAALRALAPTQSKAWIAYAEAVAYRVVDDRQSMANSLARLKQAHEADVQWAAPAREIAWTYLNAALRDWTSPEMPGREDLAREGLRYADALIGRDPRDPFGPARKAALLEVIHGDTEETLGLLREAARLGPNVFAIQWDYAQALIRADRRGDALPVMKRALRVHPRHPVALTQALAELEFAAGDPEVAFASLASVIKIRPAAEDPRLMHIYLLATLNRQADAEAAAREFLSLHPDFSFAAWSELQSRRGRPVREEWRETLLRIGIPG